MGTEIGKSGADVINTPLGSEANPPHEWQR